MSRSRLQSKKFALIFSLLIVLSSLTAVIPTFENVGAETTRGGDSTRGEGNTWYVDDDAADGGDGSLEKPYQKIQDAINSAQDNDVIRVFDGVYQENIYVNKRVTISGNGSATTTIDGREIDDVVTLRSDGISFNGFHIVNSDSSVHDGTGIIIPNNNIIVYNNTIESCRFGMRIKDAMYNTIHNNTMKDCGLYIDSLDLIDTNTHRVDTSNTVNGKPLYYFANASDLIVPAVAGQVVLSNCTNIVAKNLNCTSSSIGIHVIYSENVTISDNICNSNFFLGISLQNSITCVVERNECSGNNYDGIRITRSRESLIRENTFNSNRKYGIGTHYSQSIDIIRNICKYNYVGMDLANQDGDGSYFNVTYNTCSDNTRLGIFLGGLDYCFVGWNDLSNNGQCPKLHRIMSH